LATSTASPGDVVRITVYNVPDLTTEAQITSKAALFSR
jgi:protein involved in polysaccharide export with SLBB domain